MKNIWILTITNIKRNPLAVLLSVLGGVMLCLTLYFISEMVAGISVSKISVGMIDYDQSALSSDFKRYLTEQLNYNVVVDDDYDRLSSELIEKNISVIIEIPEGFYKEYVTGNQKDVVITSLDDYENSVFIQEYINTYLSSIHILSIGAGGNSDTFDQLLSNYHKQEISITQTSAKEVDTNTLIGQSGFINSLGFFILFIFLVVAILCNMLVEDRHKGLFNRIQVTPVKPIQYIIGSGIFGLILCAIQIIMYAAYIFFSKIQIGIPISVLILMMGLFSLFTVGFSLAQGLAINSKNAIITVVFGFSTIGNIMGGAYFPLDTVPKIMQNMARVFPQYWFMDTFRRLQADNTANIYPNIIILILFTVLCLLTGAVLFSQNYKNR